ncbi:hypothetical protein SUGI_1035670 [Cryptomeria japonica]|uniref:uncharacterized protein LOC131042793 isoform X2 n=1 Tax=Cryptomeria japonica TaxID=3369 RepID=UPI0024148EB6|nr:uncharacterized protein LOC131042793 isoform X2 [Cryptomeria japonica]GLJ49093.1 hypothetical protein SUGI_1035670 [Cryptomeria japonica]
MGAGELDSPSRCPKVFSGKYVQKQAPLLWKLFILLVLGVSGICVCFLGVDQSISKRKSENLSCPENKTNHVHCQQLHARSFPVHYPQPISYSRKECSCTPVHNFVILTMQRSGSGWFETLLNNHPNISSHGEIFANEIRRESFTSIKKVLDVVYNLDWNSSASKNDCTAAVGFKWMLNQGAMEYNKQALAYFEEKGVSVIFLLRRNILRRYVSILANVFDKEAKLLNGTHQSHVHSKVEAEILAQYKPLVNVTFLIAYLQRIQQIMDDAIYFFNSTRHTVIYYEDISKPEKITGILDFLGLQPRELRSQHVKIHTKPLSDHIQNWKEVYKLLKGTHLERLLRDS